MKDMIYKSGHGVHEVFIKTILENLGCIDIINNDYNLDEPLDSKEVVYNKNNRKSRLIPDFTCKYNNIKTAVEVGHIYSDKILHLLKHYRYVIHIFSDNKLLMMHCVLYRQRIVLTKPIQDIILNLRKYCQILLDEQELEVFG